MKSNWFLDFAVATLNHTRSYSYQRCLPNQHSLLWAYASKSKIQAEKYNMQGIYMDILTEATSKLQNCCKNEYRNNC